MTKLVVVTLSLGTLTDLAIHRLNGAKVDELDTHIVVRRDDNPGFRWGNFVQILDTAGADDVQRWTDVYERVFPDKTYRTFGLPTAVSGL